MYDKTKEIHDLSTLHESYMASIRQYHNLLSDSTKIWCKENEKVEIARRNAELAMLEYMDLIGDLYCDKENEVGERLFREKLNRKI